MTMFPSSVATHVGNVRAINEDRLLALSDIGVWLVADGMGGHEAGDYAAQTIVDSVAAIARSEGLRARAEIVKEAILAAHKIIQQASRTRGRGPIGATVTALVASASDFRVLWAGDSRLYRLRGNDLKMVTADHSVVADLVSAGQLSWEEATRHPQSNLVTRAVGVDDTLELDTITGSVQKRDRFLLCTDGLSNSLDLAALRRVLSEAPIAAAAEQLVRRALTCGGDDNLSAIVIDAI